MEEERTDKTLNKTKNLSLVEVDKLSVSFDDEIVLKDITFKVNRGEKLTITGESGTGKTTLLNAIAGFIPHFEGVIKIDNTSLSADTVKEIRKNIAWLPQDTSINLDSVKELFYAPFNFSLNKKKKPTDAEVNQIFKEFELSKALLCKKVNEISGGQKQRIILASCLLLKKPLLIIDEPTSALDSAIKIKITDYLFQLEDLTIVAVSHDKYWIDNSDNVLTI